MDQWQFRVKKIEIILFLMGIKVPIQRKTYKTISFCLELNILSLWVWVLLDLDRWINLRLTLYLESSKQMQIKAPSILECWHSTQSKYPIMSCLRMIAITVGHLYKTMGRWSSVSFKNKNIEPTRFIFDREIAQALAVLQLAVIVGSTFV